MSSKMKVENYPEKALYMMRRQGFYCAIGNTIGKKYKVTDMHHRLHNTKTNRKVFPLFINSVFNMWMVNNGLHLQNPSAGKISLLVAKEIELRLRASIKLNDWAQKPDGCMSDGIYESVTAIYKLLDEEVTNEKEDG